MTNLRTQAESNKYFGEIILIFVTLLWGATFVIVKESLVDISPMLFIAFRFTIAGILLLPIVVRKKIVFSRTALWKGVLLGFLLFVTFATQTVGLKYTTATKSAFITGSSVVMIPILQTILEKKFPTRGSILGAVLVLIGILFLSSGGNSILSFIKELGTNFNFGDFLTLICAVFVAMYVVYLDILSNKYDFWFLLTLQIMVTGLLAYITAILFSGFNIEPIKLSFSNTLLFGLLYTSIFATLITTALMTKYQKLVTPSKAGIIYSFEPIFAAILAFFVLTEKITNFGFIGSLLIFFGLIVSEIMDKRYKTNGKEL